MQFYGMIAKPGTLSSVITKLYLHVQSVAVILAPNILMLISSILVVSNFRYRVSYTFLNTLMDYPHF